MVYHEFVPIREVMVVSRWKWKRLVDRMPSGVRSIYYQRLWPFFDPGGFVVCHSRRFMFVAISKNASTSLKQLVYELDFAKPLSESIHKTFGFKIDGERRLDRSQARDVTYSGHLKFAVYRDPVDRFLSLYRDKVLGLGPGDPREYFREAAVLGASLKRFVGFAERELRKETLSQDEHLRRQSDSYSADDVDVIVPIGRLDGFLQQRLGLARRPMANQTPSGGGKRVIELPRSLERRLQALYEPDYELLTSSRLLPV